MAHPKLCIEVTVNEVVPVEDYPAVPLTPRQILEDTLECVEAGASIIHIHARDPKTGAQRFQDVEIYKETFQLIAEHCDAICYPTWPPQSGTLFGLKRFAHVVALAEDPDVALPFMDVDTGAMLRGKYDREGKRFINPDHMYVNTHGETIETLRKMQELGLKPRFGMRELGHIRHLEAFMDMGLLEEPLLLKFGFNDDLLYNLPPEPRSIQAFLDWLPDGLDYEWFTQSQGASHHVVNNSAILMGGHIRTGIGDNLLYEGRPMSTAEQVRRAAEASRSLGRDVATPAEARRIMRLEPSKTGATA